MSAKADNKRSSEAKKQLTVSGSEYAYIADSVKDFHFSDFVKIRSGPRGTLMSFGKYHPENEKFMIFSEILLPLDTAYSLMTILEKQFAELQERKLIEVEKTGQSSKGDK